MILRAAARVCLLVGLCSFVWPVAARAPILPGLSWVRLSGAESCISAIGLAQQIENKLGRSVFVPTSAAELTIEGYVAPRSDVGFVAHLAVVAADGRVLGTRVLETTEADCSTLEQALVLVIAVTLNPNTGIAGVSMLSADVQAALDGALGGELPLPVDASARGARPAARVSVPRPSADSGQGGPDTIDAPDNDASDSPRALRLDLALLGGAGMLPSPAFGAELGVAVMPRQWLPLMLSLQGFLPRTVDALNAEEGSVRFLLLRVGLLLCPESRYGLLTIGGCVGIDTGIMYVTSTGYLFDGEALRPVFDVLLQPTLRVRLSPRAALRFGFSFGFPVVRASVETRQSSSLRAELFGVSALTVALHVGVSWSPL